MMKMGGEINMAFGENLKRIREDRNVTQQELADLTLTRQQTIQRYEAGYSVPNAVIACIIAKRLGVTVEELVGTI